MNMVQNSTLHVMDQENISLLGCLYLSLLGGWELSGLSWQGV